ncbi:MAG: hypothetical protein KGN80_00895 [Acidobacteriota bacterium]|nr:hypothetical protein [Acidobacteriota bacterium]
MNQTPAQRTVILGTSLAAALALTVLILTGGRQPAPPPVPAPSGEAPLPMLEGVSHANTQDTKDQSPKTPVEPSGTAGKPEATLNN